MIEEEKADNSTRSLIFENRIVGRMNLTNIHQGSFFLLEKKKKGKEDSIKKIRIYAYRVYIYRERERDK